MEEGTTDGDHQLYVFGAGWFAVEIAGWAEESGWSVVDARSVPRDAVAIAAGGRDHARRGVWSLVNRLGCLAGTVAMTARRDCGDPQAGLR